MDVVLLGLVDLPAQQEDGGFLLGEELDVSLVERQAQVLLLFLILLFHFKLGSFSNALKTHLLACFSSAALKSLALQVLPEGVEAWLNISQNHRDLKVFFG